MISYKTKRDGFFGVSVNSCNNLVLIQLTKECEQVRIGLNKEETEKLIRLLEENLKKLDGALV